MLPRSNQFHCNAALRCQVKRPLVITTFTLHSRLYVSHRQALKLFYFCGSVVCLCLHSLHISATEHNRFMCTDNMFQVGNLSKLDCLSAYVFSYVSFSGLKEGKLIRKHHTPYSKMADSQNDLGSNTWKRGLVGRISVSVCQQIYVIWYSGLIRAKSS